MEFLSLSRRRSSSRNVPSGEERGETDVFAGYDLREKLLFVDVNILFFALLLVVAVVVGFVVIQK